MNDKLAFGLALLLIVIVNILGTIFMMNYIATRFQDLEIMINNSTILVKDQEFD